MDLLTELEAWVRALAQSRGDVTVSRADINHWLHIFEQRAKKQAEMRANVEELHRTGARLIARANKENAKEADLD